MDGRSGRTRALQSSLRWLGVLVVFLLYVVYALTRYPQFLTAGYDLGIFDQAVRGYSEFRAPNVPLKGDNYNILGDHFHPILLVLVPLYWLWDDPRVLVVAQSALVAMSIPVVWSFLDRHLSGSWLKTALIACYALSWPMQRMIDFDFHEVAFAVPLLALVVDALDRRDDRVLLLACLPLLLVREDMGMVVAMVALVRLLRGGDSRFRTWVVSLGLAVVGVVTFALVTKVVLPHFSPHGTFAYWSYTDLGDGPLEALQYMALHPLRTLELLFVPTVKAATWAFLLVPLLMLPLRSWYALIALPLLAQRFLSSRTHLWTTEFHYSAPIHVVLFLAAVRVLGAIRECWRHRLAWLMVGAHVITPMVDLALVSTRSVERGLNYPFYRLAWSAWQRTEHQRDQGVILQSIPRGTCVEADDRLAVHLTRTNRVTLPTLTRGTSDFIALDMQQKEVGYPLPSPQTVRDQALAKGYVEVSRRGDLLLLRHPNYMGARPECAPGQP